METPYVVVSERANAFGPLASLRSLWTFNSTKRQLISTYERPPYPIIYEAPTLTQLIGSIRFCDYFAFGTFYSASVLAAFFASRNFTLMF